MSALFVNDGYTINTTFQFNNAEIKLEFRPPLSDELDQVFMRRIDPNKFLASKIVSWSGLDLEKTPPTEENIRKLHSAFWNVLSSTISNYPTESSLKNS